MDQSFELASSTPIELDDLRAAVKKVRGPLYDFYARDPESTAQSVVQSLHPRDTLEEMAADLGSQTAQLFVLANVFRAALGRNQQMTKVPGHGTVSEVSVADGSLHVDNNLYIEGTLIVPGDLTVGGQTLVGDSAQLLVAGQVQTAALLVGGHVAIGRSLQAMFAELTRQANRLHIGRELDSFLLIQDSRPVVAGGYSIGLHALLQDGNFEEVFVPALIGSDGRADWNRIAQAAQAAEDVFVRSYEPPTPGEGLVQTL